MNQFQKDIEARGKPSLGSTAAVTELVITDDVEGSGDEVTSGATVTAHYVGVSASSGVQFDASWDRGSPISFPLTGLRNLWNRWVHGASITATSICITGFSMGAPNLRLAAVRFSRRGMNRTSTQH